MAGSPLGGWIGGLDGNAGYPAYGYVKNVGIDEFDDICVCIICCSYVDYSYNISFSCF